MVTIEQKGKLQAGIVGRPPGTGRYSAQRSQEGLSHLFREEEIMFQIKGPILAAMDLNKGSEELLRQADELARSYKVDLAIIHAVDLLQQMSPFYADFYSMPPMDLSDQLKKIWRQRLDETVLHFKAKGGGLLPDGPAAPAILKAASELPAQLLVMGTHGRTGLSRLVALGSVAETVVRTAPCSVLVVRLHE
jgi:universal stress protein A